MSNTETLIVIIVPIVVILALITLVAFFVVRRRRLRERFGPEYDRAVRSGDGRLSAERELHSRERRHRDLDIRELPPGARQRYAEDWNRAQQEFVDHPDRSVTDADRLVTQLMRDRGYPTEGFEQRLKDLSVEHAHTLEQYRAAHDISRRNENGEATTEELRGAMVHYRALFQELLGGTGGTGDTHRRGGSPHAA